MDFVPYAVPFFLLLIIIELAWGLSRGNNTYRLNDAINSLSLGSLSTATKLYALAFGAVVFSTIEENYALIRLDMNSPWAWLFGLLLYDFLYYWFHRISHERQIFWGSHVVHHQSEDYNLSTALRQTSTGFALTWVFYVPCFLLGMPVYMYVTIASAHLIYQFWIHTQHVPRLGFLEWFLVTPYNHRIHHAQNPAYIDKNYGGLLIIWDRMFGTYKAEEREEIVYGISTPLSSWNPLWANTHIFVHMFQDAWHTRRWRDKFAVLTARTGWRPADVAERFPHPKADLDDFHKYDPAVGRNAAIALFGQFMLIALIDIWFQSQAASMPYVIKASYVTLLFYTLIVLGVFLDRRRSARYWEIIRWVATIGLLSAGHSYALVSTDIWIVGVGYLVLSGALMWIAIPRGAPEATPLAS